MQISTHTLTHVLSDYIEFRDSQADKHLEFIAVREVYFTMLYRNIVLFKFYCF